MSIEEDILEVWKALERHHDYPALASLGRVLSGTNPNLAKVKMTGEQLHAWQLLREMGIEDEFATSFALRINDGNLLPRREPAVRHEDAELFRRVLTAKRAEARTEGRWSNAD